MALRSMDGGAFTLCAGLTYNCVPASPRSVQPRYYGQALDLAVLVGVQERVVVLERNAAVGIAVRAEHVGMREQPGPSEDCIVAADRREPQGRHAMKQRLARLQVIDMRRRRSCHFDVDEFGIVEFGAEA